MFVEMLPCMHGGRFCGLYTNMAAALHVRDLGVNLWRATRVQEDTLLDWFRSHPLIATYSQLSTSALPP
jgi:hypothetical protein